MATRGLLLSLERRSQKLEDLKVISTPEPDTLAFWESDQKCQRVGHFPENV